MWRLEKSVCRFSLIFVNTIHVQCIKAYDRQNQAGMFIVHVPRRNAVSIAIFL